MSDISISKTNSKNIFLGKKSNVVSGVSLYVGQSDDGSEIIYDAGDSTGLVLNVSTPVGTQAMAENILSALKLRGFQYQAFNSTTLLDPATEIGDTASVNAENAVIYSIDTPHSPLMTANVSAPYEEEINNEYQYESKQERTFRRQIGEVRATLSIQADEIAAKVSATGGDNQSFGWSMTTAGMFWYANGSEIMRATKNGLKVTGEIVATSGNIGGATIVNGVLTVENANIGSINGSKVVDNTLNGSKIYDGSISSGKYGTGSIYGGSGGAIASGTVSYGNVGFTGTLDQVGVNKSNIEAMNGYFTGSATFSNLKASVIWLDGKSLYFDSQNYVRGATYD